MTSKNKTIAARVAKLSAIGLLGVSIAGGAILFAPAAITARLGLDAFGESNRSSIGAVTLGAGLLLAACVAVWIWVKLIGMLRARRAAKGPEWCLRELTPVVSKGIIYPAGGTTALRTSEQPHNIQFWALRHLRKHPELLEGANGRPPAPEESFAGA